MDLGDKTEEGGGGIRQFCKAWSSFVKPKEEKTEASEESSMQQDRMEARMTFIKRSGLLEKNRKTPFWVIFEDNSLTDLKYVTGSAVSWDYIHFNVRSGDHFQW